MALRHRWLILWYAGWIALIIECTVYIVTGYGIGEIQNRAWKNFNEQSYTAADVDPKVPYAEIINRKARQTGINAQIVASLIQAESSFQSGARSAAGAYGLMQINPGTWNDVNKQYKVCAGRHRGECTSACYYNEELNIGIGTLYLSELLDKYKGNMVLALAAYNAGPGAVDQYGGMPPYKETLDYVKRVVGNWYVLSSCPVPNTILTAEEWEEVQKAAGWCGIINVLGLFWLAGRLHTYYHSWRWG